MTSTVKNLLLLILFQTIFFLYRVLTKIKRFAYFIVKSQNYRIIVSRQQLPNIVNQINLLNKLPKTVYLFSQITKQNIRTNSLQNIAKIIANYVIIISSTSIEKVTTHIECPSSQQFTDQLKQQIIDRINKTMKQEKILSKIEFSDSFHFQRQIFNVSEQVNSQKSAPLSIIFSNYKGISGMPFSYLIDSQLAFCSQIVKSSPQEIVDSFRQYCLSKQRNGK